jgi:hypothetical protein
VRAALLLTLAACFNPVYSDQTRCGADMACPAGRTCVDGQCRIGPGLADAPPNAMDAPLDGPDAPSGIMVTITKTGATAANGAFTYLANSLPMTCDAGCASVTLNVDPGTIVMLTAAAASGSYFQGFGAPCPGPARFCMFNATQSVELGPRYERINNNLMFVTSKTYDFPGAGTGLAGADNLCRAAATEAGLAGTYVAVLSDDVTAAPGRLVKGTMYARGFVRLDGKPIADTASNLLVEHRVWYPIAFDEHGTLALRFAWNGSNSDGSPNGPGGDCNGWSSTAGTGIESHTGGNVAAPFTESCAMARPVVCAGVDRGAPVTAPVVVPGKLIFVTSSHWMGSAGLTAAAALCTAEQPAGHATMPLLATTTAASAILDMDQLYVRPDGVPIGTGAELAAGALRAGIWVHGDGSMAGNELVWTGSDDFTHPGSDGNCTAWSQAGFTGITGIPVAGTEWWVASGEGCETPNSIYCVEP